MMGWADKHIQKLKDGETVSFRPHGNSMIPKIHSGDLVTVSPDIHELKKGDIVLCKVNGKQFLHLIIKIDRDVFQIGNNKGHINGWTRTIFGKVIQVKHD